MPGMQLGSGKGVGKDFYLPGARGTGRCEKSLQGCCQIQKNVQQENGRVGGRGAIGEESLGLKDAQLEHRSHQNMECAAAGQELSRTNQDTETGPAPHQPLLCISRPAGARGISRLFCLGAHFILLQFLLPGVALESAAPASNE